MSRCAKHNKICIAQQKQTINVVCISFEDNNKPFNKSHKSMYKEEFFHLSPTPNTILLPMFNEKRYALYWLSGPSKCSIGLFLPRKRAQAIGLVNIFIRFSKRVNKLKTNLSNKNYALP